MVVFKDREDRLNFLKTSSNLLGGIDAFKPIINGQHDRKTHANPMQFFHGDEHQSIAENLVEHMEALTESRYLLWKKGYMCTCGLYKPCRFCTILRLICSWILYPFALCSWRCSFTLIVVTTKGEEVFSTKDVSQSPPVFWI